MRSLQVPATVQAVLAARIDRLPLEEKRLLQIAAVVGTEVPLPLLRAMVDVSEASLNRGLVHLQAAELLYETRLFPELEYTFKHALTHEVAYESLLHERRIAFHGRVVEAMEGLYSNRLAEQVDRLAHHALHGAVWDKAMTHYQQALALADELGMRPLMAQCHLGRGKLHRHMERQEQARAALTAAIELYRAMEMTFWLNPAEAALAEIGIG
jgi:predicted ATPase